MTVLDEFYAGYLHYTVAFRLWTDTCRQLADCKGTLDERQALVDETLRLSMCVADNIDEVESLIADTLEYIQSEDTGDPDLLGAISLITNNLKEDRDRADDDTNNSPWLEEFIVRNGLGEFTGAYGYSGFCSYPQYRFYPQVVSRFPKATYRVEYLEKGRWKKLEDFGSEDEAYDCMEDQYYFDNKNGEPFVRYRVREVKGRCSDS
ncbi:DUF4313 domain-containing protein [Methanomethylophilus alvi]|uniref:DUF4313 domain-containing protein n=1 Tax=Methanomethylophilus alvi TaxID=1291540 RepID=UPI0037DD0220